MPEKAHNTKNDTKVPTDKTTAETPAVTPPAQVTQETISAAPANTNTNTEFISNPFTLVIRGFSNVFERNTEPTIILLAAYIGISFLLNFIQVFFPDSSSMKNTATLLPIIIVIILISLLINVVISGMSYLVGIQSSKGKAHQIQKFYRHTIRHLWPLIGFYLLYGILMAVGFLLFIIPGILVMYWYNLTPQIILDQNKGVSEAMQESRKMMQGMFWEWAGASLVVTLFSLGGILAVPSQGGGMGLFYQQLKTLRDLGQTKPSVHWSNYAVFFGSIALLMLFVTTFVILFILIAAIGH